MKKNLLWLGMMICLFVISACQPNTDIFSEKGLLVELQIRPVYGIVNEVENRTIRIDNDGTAELYIALGLGNKELGMLVDSHMLSSDSIARIRKALVDKKFFSMKTDVSSHSLDGAFHTLRGVCKEKEHVVSGLNPEVPEFVAIENVIFEESLFD